MTNINAYVQTFAGGEFGSAMSARVAIDSYQASCELSENWFMQAQGPMSRRPSLEYIWTLPDGDSKLAVLKGFEFDVSQNYVLPIVDGAMYFILNDGELAIPAITATIANGTFSNFTGWTDNSETGASAEAENGYLKLSSDGAAASRARTTFTVNESGETHVLAFDVINGPISMRIGTSAGEDDVVKHTELRTGHHRLEFDPTTSGTHHLQFYHDGRRSTKLIDNVEILAGGAGFSIMTPWAEEDLREIFTAQDGDRLWMFHRYHKPRILERRGHRSWSLIQFEPDDGPFDPGASTLRMTPSDYYGEITITSSAGYFEAGDVRRLLRITHPGQYVRKVTKVSGVYSEPLKVTGIGGNRAFRGIISGTFSGTVTLERSVGNLNDFSTIVTYTGATNVVWNDSFSADDTAPSGSATSDAVFTASGGDEDTRGRMDNQTVYYRWAVLPSELASGTVTMTLNSNGGSQSGVARILEVLSDTQVTAEVIEHFSRTGETDIWDISSWNDEDEYPNVCAFAHGRLWTARRKQLWSSVSDDYFSFADGTDADRSVQLTLRSKSAEGVRWMRELDFLCIGTRNEEYVIRSTSPSEPIGPTTAEPTLQGEEGGSQIEATVGGDSIVFVHRNGRRVMQFAHNPRALSEDSFVAVDLTRLNPEACEDGILNAVIQQEPERRIFAVTKAGIVKPALFRREEEIVGWQTMSTRGLFEDALVLREATEDAVYFMVRRFIDGGWVRYLERMRSEIQLNDEDLVHMDSMLETDISRPDAAITPMALEQSEATAMSSVNFDGANDYLTSGAPLTGVSDSKLFSGSFWFRLTSGPNFSGVLVGAATLAGADFISRVEIDDEFGVCVFLRDPAGGVDIASFNSLLNVPSIGDWHHVMFSFDLSDSSKLHLYLDGQSVLTVDLLEDAAADFTGNDWSIGSKPDGTSKFPGDLAELWFAPGVYIDLSLASNRAKFATAEGIPVDLGVDGSNPNGVAPAIYLSGGVADFASNNGSGGGFTTAGTLTAGEDLPVYSVNANNDAFTEADRDKIMWINGGQIRINHVAGARRIYGDVLYPLRGRLDYRSGLYEPALVPPGRWGIAAPVSSVNSLEHLEGEEVEIWADMAYRGSAVVSGGEVALPGTYSRVFVGLDMRSVWKSLRLAFGATKGTAVTQNKQVKHMGLVLDRSADSIAMGDKPGNLQKVVKANWGGLFGSAPRYFSGEAPAEPFDGSSQNDPRIIIASINPGPCTIKALIPNITVNDR